MNSTKHKEEVLYAVDDIVKVDANDTEDLKQKARFYPYRRIRICAQKNLDDNIHEMLIVHEKSWILQAY